MKSADCRPHIVLVVPVGQRNELHLESVCGLLALGGLSRRFHGGQECGA